MCICSDFLTLRPRPDHFWCTCSSTTITNIINKPTDIRQTVAHHSQSLILEVVVKKTSVTMSNNFYFSSQHPPNHSNIHSSHSHHAGRSRRATRASAAHHHQQHQKQMRALRIQKEQEDVQIEKAITFRREFEAARAFEFDDDEAFCPFNLMTEDDVSC